MYKWTCAVHTYVIQGSAVLFLQTRMQPPLMLWTLDLLSKWHWVEGLTHYHSSVGTAGSPGLWDQ